MTVLARPDARPALLQAHYEIVVDSFSLTVMPDSIPALGGVDGVLIVLRGFKTANEDRAA